MSCNKDLSKYKDMDLIDFMENILSINLSPYNKIIIKELEIIKNENKKTLDMNTKKKGKIICFEGLDYSFKETNSKRLYEYINDKITDKVKLISFPNYESISSIFVKSYLNGDYGSLNDVDPYVVSMFYAMDRYNTLKQLNINKLIDEGYYIIFDRYIGSNLCFQTTKFKTQEEKDKFIEAQLDFELSKMRLPKPDITIFMNMPVDISFDLMKKRDNKSDTAKDIHESNYKFMKQVEKESEYIIDKFDWKPIYCFNEYRVDPLNGIQYEIPNESELFLIVLQELNKNNIL